MGMIEGNQMEKFDSLDLDGEDNIYGETDITQDGHYFNGGLAWDLRTVTAFMAAIARSC
ncbi:MAG: hypothetical protein MZV63_27155 [Marinilabiliales bacterium]|nr:hypothetical protein [Marinilabiliales bacterium]